MKNRTSGVGWLNFEESKKFFLFLFHRNPDPHEVRLLMEPNSQVSLLDGLRELPEYRYWLVHNYVTTFHSALKECPKIFFRHLPRSGGTRFRTILEDASRLPAMILDDRTGSFQLQYEMFRSNFIYPLVTGHVSFSNVLSDYTEISLIREPKSRLLSEYRYWQTHEKDLFQLKNICNVNDYLEYRLNDNPMNFDQYRDSIHHAAYSFDAKSQNDLLKILFGSNSETDRLLGKVYPDRVVNSSLTLDMTSEVVDLNLLERVCENELDFVFRLVKEGLLIHDKIRFANHFDDTFKRLNYL